MGLLEGTGPSRVDEKQLVLWARAAPREPLRGVCEERVSPASTPVGSKLGVSLARGLAPPRVTGDVKGASFLQNV